MKSTIFKGKNLLHIFTISSSLLNCIVHSLSKSESVKFSQIEPVICFFTDSPVKKYILLLNQLIITD